MAIQKTSNKYSESHGGKWNFESAKIFMELNFGRKKVKKCMEEINNIFVNSLKAVQSQMHNDKHCFEMYGYDVMIDANCKVSLIFINNNSLG